MVLRPRVYYVRTSDDYIIMNYPPTLIHIMPRHKKTTDPSTEKSDRQDAETQART